MGAETLEHLKRKVCDAYITRSLAQGSGPRVVLGRYVEVGVLGGCVKEGGVSVLKQQNSSCGLQRARRNVHVVLTGLGDVEDVCGAGQSGREEASTKGGSQLRAHGGDVSCMFYMWGCFNSSHGMGLWLMLTDRVCGRPDS